MEQFLAISDSDMAFSELLDHLSDDLSDTFRHLALHSMVDLIMSFLLLGLVFLH